MSDNSRKVLEVEGGFIAKEYDEAGNVVAQSAVVETREEAETADLVDLVKKDSGIGQGSPEAMADVAAKKEDTTLPSDEAGADKGAAPTVEATAPVETPAGTEVAPQADATVATDPAPEAPASTDAPAAGNEDGAKG